jgi:hypothetical protein
MMENKGHERLGGFQGSVWRTERTEVELDIGSSEAGIEGQRGRMCRGRSW